MKLLPVVIASVLSVSACADDRLPDSVVDNYEAAADNLEAMSENTPSQVRPDYSETKRPAPHKYAFREDGLYGYIAAISEEERKQGKAAGSVIMFAYRGLEDGKHRIDSLGDDGTVVITSECEVPCVVIKRLSRSGSVVRMEYNPESILGAAFDDAINGRLTPKRLPPRPQLSAPVSYEQSAAVIEPSSPAADEYEAAADALDAEANANEGS